MAKTRYWHHPESDSLWFTIDGKNVKAEPGTELVEELSRSEYLDRKEARKLDHGSSRS